MPVLVTPTACIEAADPLPELPPAPPQPPKLKLTAAAPPAFVVELAELEPPLPPPPPTDCAKIPMARSPEVTIEPELVTATVLAVPPAPPKPPTERATEYLPPSAPDVLLPPLPPPPPIDCAVIPFACAPDVLMMLLLATVTALPVPALPPKPPTAIDAETPLLGVSLLFVG